MPSPPAPRSPSLRACFSPPADARPCSSPCAPPARAPRGPRAPRRLPWCLIDWAHVRLLHRLGAGGFGAVYKATYHGVPVALKQVRAGAGNRLASQRSFWAELNVARLRHANIVRLLAASTRAPAGLDGPGAVLMEFGGHLTLHRRIYATPEPLGPRERLRYALDVASGLRFLHAQSIVHLDLKPANVLISEQGVCKIGDFGCSQKLPGRPCPEKAPGPLGGTYTHRAPELLRGEALTPKADIYSFAITLWQLSTRELPYSGERDYVLYAVVACQLRPPLSAPVFTDSVPGRKLQSLIQRCWTPRPRQRPSAGLLWLDLHALKAEHG
ncbi:proto-oncogene serine/threonine-protein kinase mos [Sorex araneus]|uniref:proto-oncogene serine/threonine-protein kinase mos n=1 Tax=Sorex araneus TaxID=42254 RepID=UPI002433DBAA|nr:proto-oncogene serine/threonine-protein kinase mos [Sorex araneus]